MSGIARDDLVLTVTYTGEMDEVFEFGEEGKGRFFGRDDNLCEIVIWSALNGQDLSRVAGRIWRMEGELWIRNLSTRHDLLLTQPAMPPEPPLPPRRADGRDPGPARSIPGEVAYILGPGGCELVVHQTRAVAMWPEVDTGQETRRVPSVPDHLRPVAAALCEPLIAGGHLPAAYSEIMRRTHIGSLKRTRNFVGELCELYVEEVPTLRERIVERLRREEEELGLPSDGRLQGGVWRYDIRRDERPDQAESEEVRRRRALALPDYYEVAHLLVRRRLVSHYDVQLLGPDKFVDGS